MLCTVILSAVAMAFRTVTLCILVLVAVLVKQGGAWLWSTDPEDDGTTDDSLYEYPHPTFVKDNISIVAMSIANNTIIDWIKSHPWIYAVIGGVGLIVAIIVVAVICVCCYFCCRKRKRDRVEAGKVQSTQGSRQKRGSARGQPPQATSRTGSKVGQERDVANRTITNFLGKYRSDYDTDPDNLPPDFRLPDMGSRMQKYWFLVRKNDQKMVATAAPVSQKCPLLLDEQMLKGVNKLFEALKLHPYLHPFEKMDFDYTTRQVVIVQRFMDNGSLKDAIYKSRPDTDWSQKYSRRRKGLPTDKVRRYGRQILQAMLFLYSKGFPVLGHVQSGNVFIDQNGDVCRLGGYESTILGYKTRLYRLCKDHLKHFDIIMFGHLIFEMSCGYELTQLRPGQSEYDTVSDPEVKKILDFIFTEVFTNEPIDHQRAIEEIKRIRDNKFFEVVLLQPDSVIELTESMTRVIAKVQKNKPRTQPSEPGTAPTGLMGKIKHGLKKADKDEPKSPDAAGVGTGVEKKGNTIKIPNPLKKKTEKQSDEKDKLLSEDQPVPKYSS